MVPFSDLFRGAWMIGAQTHEGGDSSPLGSTVTLYEGKNDIIFLCVGRGTSGLQSLRSDIYNMTVKILTIYTSSIIT